VSNLISISTVKADESFSLNEVIEAAGTWLADKPTGLELFERFHNSSRTERRSYVVPPKEILSLGGQSERAKLFVKYGLPMGCSAVEQAIAEANLRPTDIQTVVFTSCTSPLIPALDTEILQRMGFNLSVKRIPIYQQGCAGGVVGFSLADRLSQSGENVLLISVELCSLLFHLEDSDTVDLLGAALFADGAAASVFSPRAGKLKIIDSQSHLIPETGHLMGYNIRDNGAHLRLDRDLPAVLQESLPKVVENFLRKLKLEQSDFPWWVIHPGGVKILDGIGSLLKLDRNQFHWAYDILSKTGNMSSATVQFVLSDCLSSGVVKTNDKIMMVGIGPGLTIELVAFKYL